MRVVRGMNASGGDSGWRTENPRVDGSIPSLATTSNSLKKHGFRVSPADYPCSSMADPRTIGKWVIRRPPGQRGGAGSWRA